jgi:hypothetical protein
VAKRRTTLSVLSAALFEGSFDHRFTFEEIATELHAAGFDEVTRITTPYACIIGRRP